MILIVIAGVELLFFGWLEYLLITRPRWWNLTAILPFLGAAWFLSWRDAVWLALSQENRARFGITRVLEQGFVFLWVFGLIAGLVIALCRGLDKKAKKEQK